MAQDDISSAGNVNLKPLLTVFISGGVPGHLAYACFIVSSTLHT